jgi:hypothetical protein
MTCPRCQSEITERDSVCPECGIRLMRNVSGVMKTSAVMIAAGGEQGFYRSVQDVPEPLRTQLLETTTSSNSGVIVIADRAGKEQLTQVLARQEAGPEELSKEVTKALTPEKPPAEAVSVASRLPWLAWAGFILVLVLSAVIFAIFQLHW